MGRRKDDPAFQAAKGFPGRRRKKVMAEIEAAGAMAEREPATGGDMFAVPAMFRRAPAHYRRAIEIWQSQAETLRSAGRRRPGYRNALARYCLWSQIFESAADQLRIDCPKGNYVVDWTPVNGSPRKIPHPSLKIMGDAEPVLRALEVEYGFTPRADHDLIRVEKSNQAQQSLPFGPLPTAGGREHRDDPMDLMTSTDSGPPPTVN